MTTEAILKFFADYIERHLGIVYSDANYFQLEHRLKDIAQKMGFADVVELYRVAERSIDDPLRTLILNLATNNETSFYRDAHIFKALGQIMVPDILQRRPQTNPLQIWSAAASSGQEIYTIAIELDQLRKQQPLFPEYRLLASDISDTILKKAQAGLYTGLEVQRGLSPQDLQSYFDQTQANQWQIKDSIRKTIEFRILNLLEDWGPIGGFDIIFCRNVLIYQKVENKQKVIQKMSSALNPGGYLVLGAAESLFGLSDQFEQITADKTILYRKRS